MNSDRRYASLDDVRKNVIAHELGHFFVACNLDLRPRCINISHQNSKSDDVFGYCELVFFEKYSSLDEVSSFLKRRLITLCSGVMAQLKFIHGISDVFSKNNCDLIDGLWRDYGSDDEKKFEEFLRLYVSICCEGFTSLEAWSEQMEFYRQSFMMDSIKILSEKIDEYKIASLFLANRLSEYEGCLSISASKINAAIAAGFSLGSTPDN